MSNIVNSKLIDDYLGMMNQSYRNSFFRNALQKTAKDKIVLDVGTGTGLLAAYALEAGAKFVYAIESDPAAAIMANYQLSNCFSKSRFKVCTGDFWDDEAIAAYDLPDNIDILVTETVQGHKFLEQGMQKTWYHAKQYMTDDAIYIPDRLHADGYIWNRLIEVNACGRRHKYENFKFKRELLPGVLLDNVGFADSLLKYDKMITPIPLITTAVLKTDMPPADEVIQDIISITPADYTNWSCRVYFPCPQMFCLANKISFQNETIRMHDATSSGWMWSFIYRIERPGKYKFYFDRDENKHKYNNMVYKI